MSVVHYSVEQSVAVIRLANPPVNCLSHQVRAELSEAFESADLDVSVEAVVLLGEGKVFSAGADLSEFETSKAFAEPNLHKTLLGQIESMGKPVVAAIHGLALGGGCELVLGCHYRIAKREAQIGLPEMTLGFMPGAGGTQRLPRAIGLERALDMMLKGNSISAEEALAVGLVDELIEGDLLPGAISFAKRMARIRPIPRLRDKRIEHRNPSGFLDLARRSIQADRQSPPGALALIDALSAATTQPFDHGLEIEFDLFRKLADSAEAKAFRQAFFASRNAGKLPNNKGGGRPLPFIRTARCDTLCELYLRSTQWRGNAALFVDEQASLSGIEALDQSLKFASALAEMETQPGDVIAFLCKGSARHAVAWFAAVVADRVACNLHVRETPEKLAEVIDWLGAKVLVHDESLAEIAISATSFSGIRPKRICIGKHASAEKNYDQIIETAAPYNILANLPREDDLAAIILSSGSTGKPKGVMHSQRTLLETAKGGQHAFGQVTPHDAVVILMQPSFAAWLIVGLPYIGGKAKLVFGNQFAPAHFLALIERERITMAPLVPTMWRMIFQEDTSKYDLSSLRMVSISGEPPAPDDIEKLDALICKQMTSVYFSSEACTATGVHAWRKDLLDDGKAASSGRPGVGVDLKIIDTAGSFDDELPMGEIGEIALSGPSLALGYWKDEVGSSTRFRDGWWRSGDLGSLDQDGCLSVMGRIDNIINSGGIKVSAEEIERALLSHPEVIQCAVVGQPDEKFGQRIEAYLVCRKVPTGAAMEAFCRETARLANFKIPKAFHFVDELPTGPTGKLYRRALRGR
ncbi:MAG: AMP-binding protein [Proteobacteria bacterium]|nr:AMP-binding protein [Pseudomonadota bacterium]